jgi:glycosyltransferase involved in cell wall biosynthesis
MAHPAIPAPGADRASMTVTIAICTYNRAEQLRLTLQSLARLRQSPDIAFEIVVVNNNSTDDTTSVLETATRTLGLNLRSSFEGRQGASYARNRALRESTSEIVCFLDDDVEVDPEWLQAVVLAFNDHQAALVGGRSYLIYPEERPSWLGPRLEIPLSLCDYGMARMVNPDVGLFGLNFSVRRIPAVAVGGFSTDLGRFGKNLLSGEDTDLQRRIREAGGTVIYEPNAVVGHRVHLARLRRRWFINRAYWEGVGGGIADRAQRKPHLFFSAVVVLTACTFNYLRTLIVRFRSPSLVFERFLNAVRALGTLRAAISPPKL